MLIEAPVHLDALSNAPQLRSSTIYFARTPFHFWQSTWMYNIQSLPEYLLRKVHQEMKFWWKIAPILFLEISEVLLNHEPQ